MKPKYCNKTLNKKTNKFKISKKLLRNNYSNAKKILKRFKFYIIINYFHKKIKQKNLK